MKHLLININTLEKGQKVWDMRHGEVIIQSISTSADNKYPIITTDDKGGIRTYNREGIHNTSTDTYPVLFLSNPFEHLSEYPKWMEVSNIGGKWYKRYVVFENKQGYHAMNNAAEGDDIDYASSTNNWKKAREIEIPAPIEVTLEDIAAKFGVNVSQIKIKK